jgi:hypothetical protein
MEATKERMQLVENLFDQALKRKLSQLARNFNPNLVFDLWTQIVKTDGIKTCLRKWIGKPDLTITEALDCLDDYCFGLEALLRQRQGKENKLGVIIA